MPHASFVATDRSFDADEYIELMASVHWGDPADYDRTAVTAATRAPHFVGHVRDDLGRMVGYVSAYSDGVFATFVNELVVHPSAQGGGVGAHLLDAVETAYPGVPVFAVGFRESRGFFLHRGYTFPARPLEVYAKLNAAEPRAANG